MSNLQHHDDEHHELQPSATVDKERSFPLDIEMTDVRNLVHEDQQERDCILINDTSETSSESGTETPSLQSHIPSSIIHEFDQESDRSDLWILLCIL